MNLVYEILEIRVKIKGKAVVLGIFLHAEQKSNFTCDFFGRSKFHLWGMFCDDGGIDFLPSFFRFSLF